MSDFVRNEQPRWEGDHSLGIDSHLKWRQQGLVEPLKCPVKMCLVEVKPYQMAVVHYYLLFGATRIEFGDAALTDPCLRIFETTPSAKHTVCMEFKDTDLGDMKARLKGVLGATNFSYALRNSEHMARYISTGLWYSLDMAGETPMFRELKNWLGDKALLVNALPAELILKEMPAFIQVPIYRELQSSLLAEYEGVRFKVLPNDAEMNIVVLGPTGAGKSSIINVLFNRKVAKVKRGPQSVTRHMHIYTGFLTCGATRKRLNVMDTVGFCDSVIPPGQVVKLVKGFIKANMMYLDKVVVVCAGRLPREQSDAIKKFMCWLQYSKHQQEFVFLYNQAEELNHTERVEAVGEMCGLLGVDPHYSRTVRIPNSDDVRVIPLAFATGFPPREPYSQVRADVQALYDAVLIARSDGSRLLVRESDCALL